MNSFYADTDSLCNAQYAVVVQLGDIVVSTPTNRLADGSCCVSSQSPPLCSCPSLGIRLCARVDSHDTSDTDISSCSRSVETTDSSGAAVQWHWRRTPHTQLVLVYTIVSPQQCIVFGAAQHHLHGLYIVLACIITPAMYVIAANEFIYRELFKCCFKCPEI